MPLFIWSSVKCVQYHYICLSSTDPCKNNASHGLHRKHSGMNWFRHNNLLVKIRNVLKFDINYIFITNLCAYTNTSVVANVKTPDDYTLVKWPWQLRAYLYYNQTTLHLVGLCVIYITCPPFAQTTKFYQQTPFED